MGSPLHLAGCQSVAGRWNDRTKPRLMPAQWKWWRTSWPSSRTSGHWNGHMLKWEAISNITCFETHVSHGLEAGRTLENIRVTPMNTQNVSENIKHFTPKRRELAIAPFFWICPLDYTHTILSNLELATTMIALRTNDPFWEYFVPIN